MAAARDAVQQLTPRDSNMAATAIRFVIEHPAITAAIVGIRTGQQLEEALQAIQGESFSTGQLQALKRSIPVNFYDQHR